MTIAPRDDRTCAECGAVHESMDELVDHLTNVHDAFGWATAGRPMEVAR